MGFRKLKRQIESGKFDIHPKEILVWAYMMYACKDCDWHGIIFLENTLERHNGDKHKPVPFGVICPKCKGYHCYDVSFLRELPKERPLKARENYFKDDKHHDCGVPIWRCV